MGLMEVNSRLSRLQQPQARLSRNPRGAEDMAVAILIKLASCVSPVFASVKGDTTVLIGITDPNGETRCVGINPKVYGFRRTPKILIRHQSNIDEELTSRS